MNERIRELADEAAKFSAVMALATGESGDTLFVDRFAELIVAECVTVLSVNRFDNVRPTMNIAQAMIKQHFGVEE